MSKKLEKLKEQHPEMVVDFVTAIYDHDETPTKKYTEFMIRESKDYITNKLIPHIQSEIFTDLFDLVGRFHEQVDNPHIKNKDIYSYNLEELVNAITEAEKHKTNSYIKKKETITVYNDSKFKLVIPLSHDSSKMYGAGTTWCTTTETDPTHFNGHADEGVLIYLVCKDEGNMATKRIAWFIQTKGSKDYGNDKVSIWDAQDNHITKYMDVGAIMYETITSGDLRVRLNDVITAISDNRLTITNNTEELKELCIQTNN